MFLHSRMWLGLPVAAVVAFVVIFLLRRFGEGLPTAEALWKGAVCALVIAFCWALARNPGGHSYNGGCQTGDIPFFRRKI